MSFLKILEQIILTPLKLFFELFFSWSCQLTGSPGWSIIILSLIMNTLLLPLYQNADRIQMEEQALQKKMKKGLDHIKKTFRDDERFMMTQTYYRQNNYKPVYVLRAMIPLMLEIPFFIAAYQFISSMTLLKQMSFGPIRDLASPDQWLVLGPLHLNILPILMTVINILSSLIYTKDAPLKTKIQLFAMAGVFLVLLYNSPSALVLYWTMNNLYSLVKNAITFWLLPKRRASKTSLAPAKKKSTKTKTLLSKSSNAPSHTAFILGALVLTILVGILIPSSILRASPEEFVRPDIQTGPFFYMFNSFLLAFGFFFVWFGVFYALADSKGKIRANRAMWLMVLFSFVNYMGFGRNLGNLSPSLAYDKGMAFPISLVLINLGILILLGFLASILYSKRPELPKILLSGTLVASMILSGTNLYQAKKTLDQSSISSDENPSVKNDFPEFKFSKNGSNVLIMMIDRALAEDIPFIFAEKPELKEIFQGFTFYPNTLSFGTHTNTGVSALFGGYEYQPIEMNRRKDVKLEKKHDEAIKLMPQLFQEAGYDIVLTDPSYAGYTWVPDLSVFDSYERVKAYNIKGSFTAEWPGFSEQIDSDWKRNFFWHSVTKIAPLALQEYLYDQGHYNAWTYSLGSTAVQKASPDLPTQQIGVKGSFLDSYLVLDKLSEHTRIDPSDSKNFLMMCTESTHEPNLLQKPDYVPQNRVDNSAFDDGKPIRMEADGKTLDIKRKGQLEHYHINMATMLRLGKWFQHLQEQGVYDNTRIILVSDHAYPLHQYPERTLKNGFDYGTFNCLLMEKDIHAKGPFKADPTFMTNADVPYLATKDLTSQINPFTGKALTSETSKTFPLYLTDADNFQTSKNKGKQFLPDHWYKLSGDMNDPNNWEYLGVKVME